MFSSDLNRKYSECYGSSTQAVDVDDGLKNVGPLYFAVASINELVF